MDIFVLFSPKFRLHITPSLLLALKPGWNARFSLHFDQNWTLFAYIWHICMFYNHLLTHLTHFLDLKVNWQGIFAPNKSHKKCLQPFQDGGFCWLGSHWLFVSCDQLKLHIEGSTKIQQLFPATHQWFYFSNRALVIDYMCYREAFDEVWHAAVRCAWVHVV